MPKTEFTEHEQQIMANVIQSLQDKYATMIILAVTQALANKNAKGEMLPIPEQLASIIGGGMQYLARKYNFKSDYDKHLITYVTMLFLVVEDGLYENPKGPVQ